TLLFRSEAKRLFALVASGASAGGLLGPLLTTLLVGVLGHGGLLLLSSLLIGGSAATALWLHRWRDRHPLPARERAAAPPPRRLGGNPFEGALDVFRSPYLLGIALRSE